MSLFELSAHHSDEFWNTNQIWISETGDTFYSAPKGQVPPAGCTNSLEKIEEAIFFNITLIGMASLSLGSNQKDNIYKNLYNNVRQISSEVILLKTLAVVFGVSRSSDEKDFDEKGLEEKNSDDLELSLSFEEANSDDLEDHVSFEDPSSGDEDGLSDDDIIVIHRAKRHKPAD